MFFKSNKKFLYSILLLFLIFNQEIVSIESSDDQDKNEIYINLKSTIPCIRRFNSTHQIGCGGLDKSSYEGVVFAIRNDYEFDQLKHLIELNGPNNFERKLVLVTIDSLFKKLVDYYKNLTDTNRSFISGIVLTLDLESNDFNLPYSDDTKSPNDQFSIYKNNDTFEWNLNGSSFMFEQFDIPFYLVFDKDEIEQIYTKCFDQFNRHLLMNLTSKVNLEQSMCGIQLGMQMSGSTSSTVCIRRSSIQHTLESNYFCDPLGGANYFGFLSQQPSNDLQTVLVTARMDSFSLFEYFTPGANEPVSSLIGFLSLVDMLSERRSDLDNRINILFVLFDNEAFGYGGSSRFVRDLAENRFPTFDINRLLPNGTKQKEKFQLSGQNMTTLIELNQLGSIGLSNNGNLFIHKDPISYARNATLAKIIDELTDKLQTNSNGFIKKIDDKQQQQLPPSSLHSFLRSNVENLQLAGISIADHSSNAFKNLFYHGIFDTPQNMNITYSSQNITEKEAENESTLFALRLQNAISSIGQTIYSIYNPAFKQTDLLQADQLLINRLVYCFYLNATCDFFKSVLTEAQWKIYLKLLNSVLPNGRLSFYTSVNENAISGKYIVLELLKFVSRNRQISDMFNSSEQCSRESKDFIHFESEINRSIRNLKFSQNGTCIGSSIYLVSSVSPAFDRYEEGILINTNQYSTWTESSWNGVDVQIRLFMFSSNLNKILTLLLGLFTCLVAITLTILINKYSERLFYKNSNKNENINNVQANLTQNTSANQSQNVEFPN